MKKTPGRRYIRLPKKLTEGTGGLKKQKPLFDTFAAPTPE